MIPRLRALVCIRSSASKAQHPQGESRSAIEKFWCRVEPTASSNVFLIHGKACAKSEWHPTCSHEEEGVEPLGKLYAINFKELMGDDWRVRMSQLSSCHTLSFLSVAD